MTVSTAKTKTCVLAALMLLLATATGHADPSLASVAATDTSVAEVTTSGEWLSGDRKGTYRAIVILLRDKERARARVYVQWLAPTANGDGLEVVATKPLEAFNSLDVNNAELTLDSEKSNEATLLVQSYDPAKDADQSIEVRLGLAGDITVVESAAVQ